MKNFNTFIRISLLLVVVAALIVGGFVLVKKKQQQLKGAPKFGLKPRPVTVFTAEKGTLTLKHDYLAVVEPKQKIHLTARVTAPVLGVQGDEGSQVEAGAVLVTLDGREAGYRIEAVAAQIEQAQADLVANQETIGALVSSLRFFAAEADRFQRLAEEKAVTESQAEKAREKQVEVNGRLNAAKEKSNSIRHRIDSLTKQKQELKTRLGYYKLSCPFPGVVTKRLVDPGDLASPQKSLLEIEDRRALKLSFDVPQADLPAIHKGLPVSFSCGGKVRKATLSLLHPSLNQARMVRAEVKLPAAWKNDFRPGEYVSVAVVTHQKTGVILVPRSSLMIAPDGRQHVFAVVEKRLVPRPVKILGFTGDQAAVAGIEGGTDVVRNTFLGWTRLSTGELVEAVR